MNVAIGVDFNQGGMRGGDVYTWGLVTGLAEIDNENRYSLFGYFFRDLTKRSAAIPCPDRPNFSRLIKRWPQSLVDRAERNWGIPVVESYLRLKGMDLYHSPGPSLPIVGRMPCIATFHDAIPHAHPEFTHPETVAAWRARAEYAAKNATLLIASSTATKNDLMTHLKVPEAKIRVILLAADTDVFHPVDDPAAREAARRKYSLPPRFVISAGPYEPRRNWEGILSALSRLPRERAPSIVFTGGIPAAYERKLDALIAELGLKDLVLKVGYVPFADLAVLYNLSSAFVYPSLYDGFNLPMLEAMACGTPTIVSTAGALPEIAGGASRLVAPNDPEELARAIVEVLEPSMSAELRRLGLRRTAELTWRQTARMTLEAYRDAAK